VTRENNYQEKMAVCPILPSNDQTSLQVQPRSAMAGCNFWGHRVDPVGLGLA